MNKPSGPIIEEIIALNPKFPNTGNPKDEAIYFAYVQARLAYSCLCNLIENDCITEGIYLYAWSIIDNSARLNNLIDKKNKSLRTIRNAFQHVDEKIELYKKGSIPVYGSITWWNTRENCKPEFGYFPKDLSRTVVGAVVKSNESYHRGLSHLQLCALPSAGKSDKSHHQRIVKLDKLVIDMGNEVCARYGCVC